MKDARERRPLSKRESVAIKCMKEYYKNPDSFGIKCNFNAEQRDAILNVLNGIFVDVPGDRVVIDSEIVLSFVWLSERPKTVLLK